VLTLIESGAHLTLQVAGVLKLWFSCLPEPVVPPELYDAMLRTQRHRGHEARVAGIHAVLRQCEHRVLQVLYPLMEVCRSVSGRRGVVDGTGNSPLRPRRGRCHHKMSHTGLVVKRLQRASRVPLYVMLHCPMFADRNRLCCLRKARCMPSTQPGSSQFQLQTPQLCFGSPREVQQMPMTELVTPARMLAHHATERMLLGRAAAPAPLPDQPQGHAAAGPAAGAHFRAGGPGSRRHRRRLPDGCAFLGDPRSSDDCQLRDECWLSVGCGQPAPLPGTVQALYAGSTRCSAARYTNKSRVCGEQWIDAVTTPISVCARRRQHCIVQMTKLMHAPLFRAQEEREAAVAVVEHMIRDYRSLFSQRKRGRSLFAPSDDADGTAAPAALVAAERAERIPSPAAVPLRQPVSPSKVSAQRCMVDCCQVFETKMCPNPQCLHLCCDHICHPLCKGKCCWTVMSRWDPQWCVHEVLFPTSFLCICK